METKNQTTMTPESNKQKLVIIREFDTTRELLWEAWTNPEKFMKWWGPKNFTCPFCKMDFKVGGKYLYCMRSPEGRDFWGTGIFTEIVPMEQIVFTDSFADEKGNIVPATYYGMEGFPLELQITVTFEEHDDKTKMTLIHEGIPSGKMIDLTNVSWNESFDKLEAILK
ncbi:SRPBCC family protein [Flavobacterium sp. ZS1P14]|uniref:SRPBCC family protein n=1 Tax=Flavobacterium sp. ZS1P14 TaxID=3401729 RepID=UPI003AAC172F